MLIPAKPKAIKERTMPDSAAEVARHYGIEPKKFRKELRAKKFPWHDHGAHWNPPDNSPEHHDMMRVAERMARQNDSWCSGD